ncbi:Uncharacterised protein [Klebsiella pneumoniae]|uniref:Uncharacterized protein n=1 Tax=Klebsiella pneumoniae TaxID=573 RepID=A0A377XD15_KLEPN|nr:Uncharacterised protein [Klebsiella pneumoniae]
MSRKLLYPAMLTENAGRCPASALWQKKRYPSSISLYSASPDFNLFFCCCAKYSKGDEDLRINTLLPDGATFPVSLSQITILLFVIAESLNCSSTEFAILACLIILLDGPPSFSCLSAFKLRAAMSNCEDAKTSLFPSLPWVLTTPISSICSTNRDARLYPILNCLCSPATDAFRFSITKLIA